jgi:hypothetical protein
MPEECEKAVRVRGTYCATNRDEAMEVRSTLNDGG